MNLKSFCIASVIFVPLISLTAYADDYEAGRVAANHGKFTEAYMLWKPLADSGDPRALFDLGRMYARGDGVQRNFDTARTYFEHSADKGYGPALLNLGKMYYYGDGVPPNPETAHDYFSRAASSGVADANGFLKKTVRTEHHYDSNSSVGAIAPRVTVAAPAPTPEFSVSFPPPTPVPNAMNTVPMEAPVVALPVTAAIQPDTQVPAALSATPSQPDGTVDPLAPYHAGSATPPTNRGADGRSIRFDSVAEAVIRGFSGSDAATYQNSLFYGPLVTDDKSLANYLAEANGGNPESQNIMGFAALNAGNFELAMSWFDRAAQQQNGVAIFALGNLAFDNNYAHAAELFKQASDLGIVAAKRDYGYFLIKGIGIDQDQARGRELLQQAAQQGDTLAAELIK